MTAAHEEVHNYGSAENTPFDSGENADADLDLENAIGDAFKQFAMFEPRHNNEVNNDGTQDHNNGDIAGESGPYTEVSSNQDKPDVDSAAPEVDLENVIGNVFSSLAGENEPEVSQDTQMDMGGNEPKSPDMGIVQDTSKTEGNEVDLGSTLEQSGEIGQNNAPTFSEPVTDVTPGHASSLPSNSIESSHSKVLDPKPDAPDASGVVSGESHPNESVQSSNPWNPQDSLPLPPNPETTENASYDRSDSLPRNSAGNDDFVHYNPPQTSDVGTTAVVEAPAGEQETHTAEQNAFDDDDLENAIGDAFKNLVGGIDTNTNDTEQDAGSTELEGQGGESNHVVNEHSESPASNSENGPTSSAQDPGPAETDISNGTDSDQNEDTNLEDAIGAALKSLAGEFDTSHATKSENPPPAAIYEEKQDQAKTPEPAAEDDAAFDLGDIVKNVVSQITGLENSSTDPSEQHAPAANREVSRAQSHVSSPQREYEHSHSSVEQRADTPDDYESTQDLDAALKAAVANAVKSAFPSEPTNIAAPVKHAAVPEKESDIEQLQMNEILQNAFNMAMQNPQELLTTLDKAEDANRAQKADGVHDTAQAMDKAITELFVKEMEDSKYADKSTTESSHEAGAGPKKPLSIAETLALHRASMSSESQRDYSIINTLEDSVRSDDRLSPGSSQNHPQLSTILSSLSQHIQSGTQSSTLMSVIRQMTNALMHNKKYPASFSKGGQEIIKSIKASDEKVFYMTQLRRAKRFLQECIEDASKVRAVALLENILESIEVKKAKSVVPSPPAAEEELVLDSCMQYYESAHSTLANLDVSRLELAMSGVKFDVDSNEHKSRVREGNRERKKKWREENAERNKDNDLRCRVLKRAALKFGEISSEEKTQWIEREYEKRKARRMSRQKKNEDKAETSPANEEPPAQDPLLVTRLTESFNLVAECGIDDESRAVMVAVCALAAVVAASCAQILDMQIYNISPAVSQILTSIYDSGMRAGGSRKFLFLLKPNDSLSNLNNREVSKEEILRRLAALKGLDASGSQGLSTTSALDVLRDSQKRLGLDVLESSAKRLKTGPPVSVYQQDPPQDNDYSVPSSEWYNASSLKMPSYKTPQQPATVTDPELFKLDHTRRDYVERIPKIASPFISNKFDNESTLSSAPKALKKPGSLQRPVFSKPVNRAASLGFPTLYSTSFKSN